MQHYIDVQMNDVTPAVLFKLTNKRATEKYRVKKNESNHIFDRGKNTIPYHPTYNWESLKPKQQFNHYTLKWKQNDDGNWYDPFFTEAKISKVTNNDPPMQQSDSGANRIVTDQFHLLHNVTFIENYPMGGCSKDEVAITCTAKGKLELRGLHGETIWVEAYYSKEVDGTIVSPTTIVRQHDNRFTSFSQHSNCDTNDGAITFIARDGHNNFQLPLKCINDLWYHVEPSKSPHDKAKINKLSAAAAYKLWHQRTGHAGVTAMKNLSTSAIGTPTFRANPLYRCPTCMSGKLTTKRKYKGKPTIPKQINDHDEDICEATPKGSPGQHFHIDFGFVKGKDDDNRTVHTSIDGYNCYVLIIDRVTRFTWVFLAKNKRPPVETIRQILVKFKSENENRTVRTDQGG